MDVSLFCVPREELQPPPIRSVATVEIVHPGLHQPLLSFPALDPDPSGSSRYGIIHLLALDGCRVLTNNEPTGYLANDVRGKDPVSCNDYFLPAGRYFYFVGSRDAPTSNYKIVAEFDAWSFPHKSKEHVNEDRRMPDHWSRGRSEGEIDFVSSRFYAAATAMSAAVKAWDLHCIVTKHTSIGCAYLISHFQCYQGSVCGTDSQLAIMHASSPRTASIGSPPMK